MSVQKAKNHLSVIMKIALTLQSPQNNLEGPRCTPGESLALTHSLLLLQPSNRPPPSWISAASYFTKKIQQQEKSFSKFPPLNSYSTCSPVTMLRVLLSRPHNLTLPRTLLLQFPTPSGRSVQTYFTISHQQLLTQSSTPSTWSTPLAQLLRSHHHVFLPPHWATRSALIALDAPEHHPRASFFYLHSLQHLHH